MNESLAEPVPWYWVPGKDTEVIVKYHLSLNIRGWIFYSCDFILEYFVKLVEVSLIFWLSKFIKFKDEGCLISSYSWVSNKHVYTLKFLTFFSSIHFLIRYYTFINFVFIIQATWSIQIIQNIFSMKLCFWYMLFQILIENNQKNATILIFLRKIETLMLMI